MELPDWLRRCSKCGRVKPPEDFYRKAAARSGLTRQCRECFKADVWRRRRTKRGQAVLAAYRARPEAQALRRADQARYRRAHPGRSKAWHARPRSKLLGSRAKAVRALRRESDPARRARLIERIALIDRELARLAGRPPLLG